MLMYPLEEAITLLSGKLVAAKRNLEETIEDLEWLREQSTVMEVNFARVHNVRSPPLLLPFCPPCPSLFALLTINEGFANVQWDVKRRRDLKARGEIEEKEEKE
jgi:hypothetical protein